MDRVKKYIDDYTLRCSNELEFGGYQPWLKPYHAEAVAQIAREEIIEKVTEWVKEHIIEYRFIDNWGNEHVDVDLFVEDITKAMSNE